MSIPKRAKTVSVLRMRSVDRMDHPDVLVVIDALVALDVDLDRPGGLRNHVHTGLGEPHPRPRLPVRNRTPADEGPGRGTDDAGSEPGVESHPRVERQAVLARPADIVLDRDERVALL